MTIKKRIIFSSIILISLLISAGVTNWIGNNSILHEIENVVMLERATMHVQGMFRGINEFIIDEGEPLSIELTQKHVAGFDEIHNQFSSQEHEAGLHQLFDDKVSPAWLAVRDSILSFLKDNPYISVSDDSAMRTYGKIISDANVLLGHVEDLSEMAQTLAESASRRTKNIISAVTLSVLGIIIFILFNLYRTISSPVEELKNIASSFSRGDLSVTMNNARKDEFGEVASFFNTATEKMNAMISGVQNLIHNITRDSETLSTVSAQINHNAQEQSSQTGQAASAIDELNSSFIDVAKNTAHAAGSSKEASELAIQGGLIVSDAIAGINRISHVVNESAKTIEALGLRSEQIGEIIKVINDIAGQTNLLALNAAIEAARAGDQGRGFAVVADEVRKLAERTTSATNEISEMIIGFQDGTQKAVESMHSGTTEVEEGVKLSNAAGEALQKIVASANSVTEMVQQIATAAEEQSSTGDVIASNVESVANIAQLTADSAHEAANSTQDLNKSILELKQLIGIFTLRNNAQTDTVADKSLKRRDGNRAPLPSG